MVNLILFGKPGSGKGTQAEFVKRKYNKNYLRLNENEKIDFLKSNIKSGKNFINKFKFKNKENKEVWETFNVISQEPSECLGAYVISTTSSA